MSGIQHIDGRPVQYGFWDIMDWISSVVLSFPAPWSLAPLEGKYYGTRIVDARGKAILRFWLSCGEPSNREKESFDVEWTPEFWADYCCDSHWESQITFDLAKRVVNLRNDLELLSPWEIDYKQEVTSHLVMTLLHSNAQWGEMILEEVVCGGPNRRAITEQ